MAQKEEKPSWKKFSKLKFSQKSLSNRVRKLEKGTVKHARRFVSSRLDRLSSVRRAVFGWIVLVLVLAGISTVQLLNFRDSYMIEGSVSGGTYSEGVLGPLETLNPLFARTSAERSASRLLFASLYNYDDTGHLKGDLAESVKVNDKETEYTVKLLPGVKWSDGAPLTANDVVFTTNLMKDPATGSVISGWELFEVKAIDARTILFKLPSTYAPFMSALTFPILPEHAFAGIKPSEIREQPFSKSPITSGPFALRMLQNVASDGSKKIAHLVANPRYIHGQPKLERFQLTVYASRDDIATALKTNEIMATSEVVYDSLAESTKAVYSQKPFLINNGVFAILNMKSEVLKNQNVRQALALSVDRQELRKNVEQSSGALDGPIISSLVSEKLPAFPAVNVEKSKELLDKEGWRVSGDYRKKDGKTLEIKMVALKGAGFSRVTEELAKVWRKELSIRVNINIVDPLDPSQSVLQAILQPRNFDVLVYEFVIGGDPDVYAYWHSTQAVSRGLNFANYSNDISDDALSGARTKRDSRYRTDRYQAFVKRWVSDIPAIPLYQQKIDYIYSRKVSALSQDTKLVYPEDRYSNVIYWTVDKASVYKTP